MLLCLRLCWFVFTIYLFVCLLFLVSFSFCPYLGCFFLLFKKRHLLPRTLFPSVEPQIKREKVMKMEFYLHFIENDAVRTASDDWCCLKCAETKFIEYFTQDWWHTGCKDKFNVHLKIHIGRESILIEIDDERKIFLAWISWLSFFSQVFGSCRPNVHEKLLFVILSIS